MAIIILSVSKCLSLRVRDHQDTGHTQRKLSTENSLKMHTSRHASRVSSFQRLTSKSHALAASLCGLQSSLESAPAASVHTPSSLNLHTRWVIQRFPFDSSLSSLGHKYRSLSLESVTQNRFLNGQRVSQDFHAIPHERCVSVSFWKWFPRHVAFCVHRHLHQHIQKLMLLCNCYLFRHFCVRSDRTDVV